MTIEARGRLLEVLSEARRRGLVGPVPVEEHLSHAIGFLFAWGDKAPVDYAAKCVDLGSGGGVPGLALAVLEPARRWVLLDSRERATRFLEEAVAHLGLAGRVEVVHERAEVSGRSALRGSAPLVVARAFGPPAVTAECAAPFLVTGGRLIVSNPPEVDLASAWPTEGLTALGMGSPRLVRTGGSSFTVVTQEEACPDRFPRRSGMPAKRPLF